MERVESVAVVGAGSWGTAFAAMLAGRHGSVTLWAHETEVCADLRDRRENRAFLPGIVLPPAIRPTADLEEAVSGKSVVVFAVPSTTCGRWRRGRRRTWPPTRASSPWPRGWRTGRSKTDDGGARRNIPFARPPCRGAFRPDLRPRGCGGEADGGDGGRARPIRRPAAAARAVRVPRFPPLRRRRRDGDRDRRGAEKRDGDRRGDGRRAGVRPQRARAPHLPGARRDLPAGRPPRGASADVRGARGDGGPGPHLHGRPLAEPDRGDARGAGRGSPGSSPG